MPVETKTPSGPTEMIRLGAAALVTEVVRSGHDQMTLNLMDASRDVECMVVVTVEPHSTAWLRAVIATQQPYIEQQESWPNLEDMA